MKSYPTWLYILLLTSISLLIITGLLLIPTALSMRLEWDVSWSLSGTQRLYSVGTHTLVSYIMLGIVGVLYPIHMRTGLRTKKGYRSGLSLVTVFAVLLLTGVGLFYLGSIELLSMSSILHMGFGVLLVIIFAVHYIRSRLSKG